MVKRWRWSVSDVYGSSKEENSRSSNSNKYELRCLKKYEMESWRVRTAVEIDDETFVTASYECTVWNKTTGVCLHKKRMHRQILSMLKTRDGSKLLCGMFDGDVLVLRLPDLQLLTKINLNDFVASICELEDGTFVAAAHKKIKRWGVNQHAVSQLFIGHLKTVHKVIELKRDIIVSASEDKTVKIWKVSSGECLHTLNRYTTVLVKLQEGYFASASNYDNNIAIHDENGSRVASYPTDCNITAMTRLRDGSIVSGNVLSIEIRKPYVCSYFFLL